MSSIFQQKTIKPDDIDADFLKHVQFAAQRGSPMSASFTALADDQQPSASAAPAAQSAVQEDPPVSHVSSAVMQPMHIEEFTLDKIEQSIADIEAELGWTTGAPEQQPVAAVIAVSPAEGFKPIAAPASILTSSKTSGAGQSSSAGTAPAINSVLVCIGL